MTTTPLSEFEQKRLAKLEKIIERGLPALSMSAEEARACVDAINGHVSSARHLLLGLYELEGWKALGYASWRECATAEFKLSQPQVYRELEAAKIERRVSPMGEIGQIPERQVRPLTRLEPEQQKEAWERAVETAPEGKVTAKHVEETVREMRPETPRPKTYRPDPNEETMVVSYEFNAAFETMLAAIQNARADGWKATPRRAALRHIAALYSIAEGGD